MDYENFRADLRTVYAVTRCLEIISEASRRLPQQLKERHPHMPWIDIAGAGNIYRHNYEDVLEAVLWRTSSTLWAVKSCGRGGTQAFGNRLEEELLGCRHGRVP
jgi:uncharacterized protein with HEPN domain